MENHSSYMDNSSFYEGKRILVTGGAGSIGSEIVKKLLFDYNPLAVRVLDNNETALHDLNVEINKKNLRPLYGSILDHERLLLALEDVDIVFHAAAMKNVPVCEFNPFEAIQTNIIGTQNVITTSIKQNVDKFILISTDKAVNPSSIMGITKLLAERLTQKSNYYRGNKRTKLFCVRFGNVLKSRGSVIPLFLKQIQNGHSLTLTDKDMTRFMMSIPDAINFILQSAEIGSGGEIFIKKMDSVKIYDVAKVMKKYYAHQFGNHPESINIEVIGKRIGEKIHEELLNEDEIECLYHCDDFYVILPDQFVDTETAILNRFIKKFNRESKELLSSETPTLVHEDDIINLINKGDDGYDRSIY